MSAVRIRAVPVLWWVGLAGLTILLHVVGAGVLGPAPWLHPHRVLAWWQERGPLVATFAAAREVLCAVGAYLWALWTVVAVATWASSARLLSALSRCRLPGARASVRTVVGLSALGAALVAGAAPTFAADTGSTGPAGEAATPVLRYMGTASAPPPAPVLRDAGPVAPVDAAQPRATPTTTATAVPPAPRVAHHPAPRAAARAPTHSVRPSTTPAVAGTWTVRPGDDLWSIAEASLSRAWGVLPPEPDLSRYWWQVVQTNRPHLPNPADPSLLLPGDVVAIPVPPPRPASLEPR
jgi:hypothetical protein